IQERKRREEKIAETPAERVNCFQRRKASALRMPHTIRTTSFFACFSSLLSFSCVCPLSFFARFVTESTNFRQRLSGTAAACAVSYRPAEKRRKQKARKGHRQSTATVDAD